MTPPDEQQSNLDAPSRELMDELLARAYQAALAAGSLVSNRPEVLEVDSKTTATDVVTQMDRASEKLLVELLLDGRETDGVLGEEGADRQGTSGVRWIIDPIDGTVNYLYGWPLWAVCVGVEYHGVPISGVVHMPGIGETYVGSVGGGSFRITEAGRTRLRINETADPAMALVATGFGYSAKRRGAQAAVVAQLATRVRDFRRAGACAVDLCFLAGGRVDAYFERGAQPWDHTAAGVIATEAGAIVSGLRGRGPSEEMVVAGTPAVHAALVAWLEELNADTDDVDEVGVLGTR